MSYSDSSQLLIKQAELKTLQQKYDSYTNTVNGPYQDISSASITITANKNAISTTNPPPGTSPGEDFGEYWKFVSSGAPTAAECWTSASRDERIFQKVVYTGADTTTNKGDASWNQQCYGLIWNAPPDASYNTDAPGYSTMVSNAGFTDSDRIARTYTKSGITSADKLNEATQIANLKSNIDSLVEEIALIAGSSINSELSALSQTSADQKTVIQKINQYMNSSSTEIANNYKTIDQRKNLNNLYEDINKQITLTSRKYKFVFYFIIGIVIIISYMSYVSKLPIPEQLTEISKYIAWGWWTNWGVITFVVVLLVLSSFGWDMKGNIMMIWRYISDPDFWTGQMWWVGVSFLFLIVIFLHASFKSFFGDTLASLEKMGGEGDSEE
jgi:hypothetical protein